MGQMTTRDTYPQEIKDYLQQLDLESGVLSVAQRRTLRSQIEGHLDEALTSSGDADARQILVNLGDPRELVQEELAQEGIVREAPVRGPGSEVRPSKAFTFLLVALLVIGAAWAIGSLILLVAGLASGAFPGWLLITSIVGFVVGSLVVALTARQLRKQRRQREHRD